MKWLPLLLLVAGCATAPEPVQDRVTALIESGDACRAGGDLVLRDCYDTRKLNALTARRDFAVVENLYRRGQIGQFDYEQARRDYEEIVDHLETARDRLCSSSEGLAK